MNIMDLETTIGKTGNAGQGATEEQKDGTWLAWIFTDDVDGGLYASGSSEGHALAALAEKVKAMGAICNAAYAEAESRYKVRKSAEAKEMADKLIEALKGGGRGDALFDLPSPKKAEGGN